MRVAVLMGGNSSERDVSFVSGKAVVDVLKASGYEVDPCPYEVNIDDVLPVLQKADVVFNALHGGEGENGTVQGLLESLGMRYTGSEHEASAVAMNKHLTKLILDYNSFPTPPWLHLNLGKGCRVDLIEQKFSYPVVVKPNADGSTLGVSIVRDKTEVGAAIQRAREFGPEVLVEQYIPGREITVGILGEKVLPVIEIFPTHELYDYSCKYSEGMSQYKCPAELTDELEGAISDTAMQIALSIGYRHYCRVDFRLNSEGEFFCLELNTLPGMTGTSLVPKAAKAAGISFGDLVRTIVEMAANE